MSAPTLQLEPRTEPTSSFLPLADSLAAPQSSYPASDFITSTQSAFGNSAVANVASRAPSLTPPAYFSNSEAVRTLQPAENDYGDESSVNGIESISTATDEAASTEAPSQESSPTGAGPISNAQSTTETTVPAAASTIPGMNGIGKTVSPIGGTVPAQSAASTEVLFNSFSMFTATDIAAQLGVIGDSLAGQFSSDRSSYVESAPALSVTIAKDQAAETLAASAGPAPVGELPSAELVSLAPPGKSQPLTKSETGVPQQPEGESVGTSAGAPPQFRADGEADASRMTPAAASARDTAQQASQTIANEISTNTSANRMVPIAVERLERIELPSSTAVPQATQSLEMLEYLQTDVGGDVRAIADSYFAPLLESSLAAPRSQVANAAKSRDIERQTAFDEAQVEADSASAAASTEQQQAIADGRALVETEKQKGLAEQQEELAKFDGEVSSRHQTQQEEIARTVESEQARADEAVAKGEADAREQEALAKEAEARERSEREQNKPKKKKKKWHEKVGDWFKNAIKKWTDELVKAVKQVFDVAKTVVTKVLNEAKKLAVGIITALRDTVVGMIKVFAEGLKLLVSGLLFAFPKLRDKVNAAIDGVVEKAIQIVDAVAKKLEETVVALIDRVQSTVNKTLDFFESVIVTQIQIAGALLSGNFLEAAKILFLAACKAVGIPGEEFLDILADANDALMDIIKRPALFLRSLLKSVGQGMSVFFANFPARMMAGLTGWLFGQVAQGGISMIKSFDLKSIFMLLLEVMGFTYDYIRARVVRLVGERAVETIEKVMEPIRILFTEGPGALWQWIGGQVELVKNAIMEAASQWIVTQIITQATIKIASMFTPVGAFVQAVLMMYNTIMYFVEKIKEIFAWVKSITSSFKTMAVGAVEAAANYIDQSMSKSIPLIIAFLARLLGVGGIGEKIRDVMTKLRAPLDKGIDFVLGKIVELAKKAWGGIEGGASAVKQSFSDWWNAKKEFTTEIGERHELYFTGEDQQSKLTIASTPTPFSRYLKKLESLGTIDHRVIFDLRWRNTELEQLIAEPQPKTEQEVTDRRNKIFYKMAGLTEILQRMPRVEEQLSEGEMIARFSAGLGLESQECRAFMTEEGITSADVASFAVDMTPVVGTAKSIVELFSGTDPITGEEASRWWAVVGLIPFGKLGRSAKNSMRKVLNKRNSYASTTKKTKIASSNKSQPKQQPIDTDELFQSSGATAVWSANKKKAWMTSGELPFLVGSHASLGALRTANKSKTVEALEIGALAEWESHHIIEAIDLLFIGVSKANEKSVYNRLPAVLLPKTGHKRVAGRLNSRRPFNSVDELRDAYIEAYEHLGLPKTELVILMDKILKTIKKE